MHNICPITNEENFDCLINVMSALLLHFEVILFPIYLINILWQFFESMQKLCNSPISHPTFNLFTFISV